MPSACMKLRPGPSYFADNITLEERHDRRRAQRIAEAEEHIIKSALRMAAARLTENATQKYKSYHEMFEAMRKREEASNEKFDLKKETKMAQPSWGKPQVIIPQEPKPPKSKSSKQKLQEKEEDEGKRLTLALALQAAEKSSEGVHETPASARRLASHVL